MNEVYTGRESSWSDFPAEIQYQLEAHVSGWTKKYPDLSADFLASVLSVVVEDTDNSDEKVLRIGLEDVLTQEQQETLEKAINLKHVSEALKTKKQEAIAALQEVIDHADQRVQKVLEKATAKEAKKAKKGTDIHRHKSKITWARDTTNVLDLNVEDMKALATKLEKHWTSPLTVFWKEAHVRVVEEAEEVDIEAQREEVRTRFLQLHDELADELVAALDCFPENEWKDERQKKGFKDQLVLRVLLHTDFNEYLVQLLSGEVDPDSFVERRVLKSYLDVLFDQNIVFKNWKHLDGQNVFSCDMSTEDDIVSVAQKVEGVHQRMTNATLAVSKRNKLLKDLLLEDLGKEKLVAVERAIAESCRSLGGPETFKTEHIIYGMMCLYLRYEHGLPQALEEVFSLQRRAMEPEEASLFWAWYDFTKHRQSDPSVQNSLTRVCEIAGKPVNDFLAFFNGFNDMIAEKMLKISFEEEEGGTSRPPLDALVQNYVRTKVDSDEDAQKVLEQVGHWRELCDVSRLGALFADGATDVEMEEDGVGEKVQAVIEKKQPQKEKEYVVQPRIELLLAEFVRRGVSLDQISIRESEVKTTADQEEQENPYVVLTTPYGTILVRNLYRYGTYVVPGNKYVPDEAFAINRSYLQQAFGAKRRNFVDTNALGWLERVMGGLDLDSIEFNRVHSVSASELQNLYSRFSLEEWLSFSGVLDGGGFVEKVGCSFDDLLKRCGQDLDRYKRLSPFDQLLRFRRDVFAEESEAVACIDWDREAWRSHLLNGFPTHQSVVEATRETLISALPQLGDFVHSPEWVANQIGFLDGKITKQQLIPFLRFSVGDEF